MLTQRVLDTLTVLGIAAGAYIIVSIAAFRVAHPWIHDSDLLMYLPEIISWQHIAYPGAGWDSVPHQPSSGHHHG